MIKIIVDLEELRAIIRQELINVQMLSGETWITFKQAQEICRQHNYRSSYHTLKNMVKAGSIRQQGRKLLKQDLIKNL